MNLLVQFQYSQMEDSLLTMDSGGSENANICYSPENGRTVLVSDGESRNGSVLWSRDGESFGTTRRNGTRRCLGNGL